jgi:hypothetical protein
VAGKALEASRNLSNLMRSENMTLTEKFDYFLKLLVAKGDFGL